MREILQLVGTESFRDMYSETMWIDFAERFIQNSGVEVVVVPDVRFENEAAFIKENGILIKVDPTGREGFSEIVEKSHASEAGFSIPADYEVQNSGSLEELYGNLEHPLSSIVDSWNTLSQMSSSRMKVLQEELIKAKKELFSL